MAELTHKKRVRGGHRSSAKKMVGELDELLEALEDQEPLAASAKLTQLKRSLEEKIKNITILDTEIVALIDGEELTKEIELRS